MKYTSATHDFSGIQIDSFVTEGKQVYVTLSSIAEGLKVSYDALEGWTRKGDTKSKGIPVTVGIRQKAATAYPVSVILDFLAYRVSLKDIEAVAFVLASTGVDITRTVMEVHLETFTLAQAEELRVEIRFDFKERLANYVKQSQEQGYYVNHVWDASITSGENQALADLLSLLSLKGQIEYELSSNKGKLSLKGQDNLKQAKKLEAKLSEQGILPDGAECPAKSPEAIESERKVASFYSQLENSQRQLSTMLADSRFMQCDLGKSEVNRLSQTIEAAKAGLKTQGVSC